jgi:hypothetical protein
VSASRSTILDHKHHYSTTIAKSNILSLSLSLREKSSNSFPRILTLRNLCRSSVIFLIGSPDRSERCAATAQSQMMLSPQRFCGIDAHWIKVGLQTVVVIIDMLTK